MTFARARRMGAVAALLGITAIALPNAALERAAEAGEGYKGYLRCEDIKIKDLDKLRSGAEVSVKASTMMGSSTVVDKGAMIPNGEKASKVLNFGIPAMKTHSFTIADASEGPFELRFERRDSSTTEFDIAVCVGRKRLSVDGDEQKSSTIATASVSAKEGSVLIWNRKTKMEASDRFNVLIQPRSVNTSTSYLLTIKPQ